MSNPYVERGPNGVNVIAESTDDITVSFGINSIADLQTFAIAVLDALATWKREVGQ